MTEPQLDAATLRLAARRAEDVDVSYNAGLSGFSKIGVADRVPHILCDGCGLIYALPERPPSWFLDGKTKPGWRLVNDGIRRDYCHACKKEIP